jgi:hypothetical protein
LGEDLSEHEQISLSEVVDCCLGKRTIPNLTRFLEPFSFHMLKIL